MEAPCVIDFGNNGYFGSEVSYLYVPNGYPKGIAFPAGVGGPYFGSMHCDRVDNLNGNQNGFQDLDDLSPSAPCYWTSDPTQLPTSAPTASAIQITTGIPTMTPTKDLTISTTAIETTTSPSYGPSIDPTLSPTSTLITSVIPSVAPTAALLISSTTLEQSETPDPISDAITSTSISAHPSKSFTSTSMTEANEPESDDEAEAPSITVDDDRYNEADAASGDTDTYSIIIIFSVIVGLILVLCIIALVIYKKRLRKRIESEITTKLEGERSGTIERVQSESMGIESLGGDHQNKTVGLIDVDAETVQINDEKKQEMIMETPRLNIEGKNSNNAIMISEFAVKVTPMGDEQPLTEHLDEAYDGDELYDNDENIKFTKKETMTTRHSESINKKMDIHNHFREDATDNMYDTITVTGSGNQDV